MISWQWVIVIMLVEAVSAELWSRLRWSWRIARAVIHTTEQEGRAAAASVPLRLATGEEWSAILRATGDDS